MRSLLFSFLNFARLQDWCCPYMTLLKQEALRKRRVCVQHHYPRCECCHFMVPNHHYACGMAKLAEEKKKTCERRRAEEEAYEASKKAAAEEERKLEDLALELSYDSWYSPTTTAPTSPSYSPTSPSYCPYSPSYQIPSPPQF